LCQTPAQEDFHRYQGYGNRFHKAIIFKMHLYIEALFRKKSNITFDLLK
jgi:hypothetical protein